MEIYLDNSATTKVCSEAVNAMLPMLTENFGNPSAVHSKGAKAKKALEAARAKIAGVMSVQPEEIYFSNSGTLANNTAILGAANAGKRAGKRIVTTAVEHPSVMRCMDELEKRGFEIIRLRPAANGAFCPDELFEAVNKNTILVSTMLVNNETGAVNPVEQIQRAVRHASAPALIHVDAIQGFGKMPVKPYKFGADLVTISGHKIHGPKGVGALYIKKGCKIKPFVLGGGQENGMFSGTEALPAIAGFGAAAAALPNIQNELEMMKKLRSYALEKLCLLQGIQINSPRDALPYIINMSCLGIPSQVMINFLSERDIYVSAGSACKRGHRSEVLSVMGLPPRVIDSAIRVSMSRFTTEEEIDLFVKAIEQAQGSVRTKL